MKEVKKQKPIYKQMALETAVRNPERYKDILSILIEYDGVVLNDENLLEIVTHLYNEEIVKASNIDFNLLSKKVQMKTVIEVNSSRRADGGFPSGYSSRFWTYVRTLSEFGFLYARYNEPLKFSSVSKLLVEKKIDEQIAFATQSAIYNRKSPFRNVSNDFNYFKFITKVLIKLNEDDKGLSYEQFIVSLFNKSGDVNEFISEIKRNVFADSNSAYEYVKNEYNATNKENTVTKDYPDVVLRLLKLTGFISIKYTSKLKIILNTDSLELIEKIFTNDYSFTEEQKNNALLYFNQYSKYSDSLLSITTGWTVESDDSIHSKLERVVKDYEIDINKVKNLINDLDENKNREFKYVPTPLKLEFYLSILLYLTYGEDHMIIPNYKTDSLGMPISHAPGNNGDIYVYSDNINWLIEVTMIRNKQQQLNHETTSVIRHLEEDSRERYLSFVAPYVHPDTKNFYDNEIIRLLLSDTSVFMKTYTIKNFLNETLKRDNLDSMRNYTNEVIDGVRSKLTR
ncbi:MAG: AlwI family type II restriction endonuclease [Acholeplasmataceae bacterium]|nr:AlwI family type II restriction endonuclease [Acholeplasmataceae bacterium]